MTIKPDRVRFFKKSLPVYRREASQDQMELVVVEEISGGIGMLWTIQEELLDTFCQVQWIRMDKRRSKIRPVGGASALGLNIAIRNASNDALLATHPECLQLGTVRVALNDFRPDSVTYFETYKSDKTTESRFPDTASAGYFDMLVADGVDNIPFVAPWRPNCWYGMAYLFSKTLISSIGAVEESTMLGFGCEDDILGWMLVNNGIPVLINTKGKCVHLWHPTQEETIPIEHYHRNYNLCEKIRKEKIKTANVGHYWGSEDSVISIDRWAA